MAYSITGYIVSHGLTTYLFTPSFNPILRMMKIIIIVCVTIAYANKRMIEFEIIDNSNKD